MKTRLAQIMRRSSPRFSSGAAGEGVFFDVGADFGWGRLRGRRRRVQHFHNTLEHIHDSGFMNVQATFKLVLQRGEFSSERASVIEGCAHS